MKTLKNIAILVVLCIVCSNISMYAVTPTTSNTGHVNLNVLIPLSVTVDPVLPEPDPSSMYVSQSETREFADPHILLFTVTGQELMNISLTFEYTATDGHGVTLHLVWLKKTLGTWPVDWRTGTPLGTVETIKKATIPGSTISAFYTRCLITGIEASPTADLGLHTTDVTLRAAYIY